MKNPNYKYLVEGPRGGVLVCSTKAEAKQLTQNGGSYRALTAAEKRAVDSQSRPHSPRPKKTRSRRRKKNPALGKGEQAVLVKLDAALASAQKQAKGAGIPSIRAAALRKVKHYG
ncbi:hypothetical protein K0U83_26595, partial [bacterium]|nr:hypothetical protein [bacterium]